MGGAVASWLVRLSSERGVLVQATAGDIVLCSWVRHFTLTVPLSTQVYSILLSSWTTSLHWAFIPDLPTLKVKGVFLHFNKFHACNKFVEPQHGMTEIIKQA